MHPRILAARNQAAMESIVGSARRIAVSLGREPGSLFDGTWTRDPECRALFEREAVDKFLVSVADALESGDPKAATVTAKVEAEEDLAALQAEGERIKAEAEAAGCVHPWEHLRWRGDETKLICATCDVELDPDEPMRASRGAPSESCSESEDEEPPSQNLELWGQLPANAREALEGIGITSAAEVAGMTDAELRAINGIGAKTLAGIREVIPAFTQE